MESFRLQKTANTEVLLFTRLSPRLSQVWRVCFRTPFGRAQGLSPFGSRAFRLLLRASPSAHSSFLLSQVSSSLAHGLSLRLAPHACTTYTYGWIGRGTGVSPREDNHAVLVSLRLPIPARISSRGSHARCVSPPGFPGRLWSLL